MVRESGAKEVHIRIASPPVKFPCYYGIDTPTSEELAAAKMNVEGLCKDIGADSLSYLSIGDMLEAIGLPPNNVCTACFSGDYLNGGKEDELDL